MTINSFSLAEKLKIEYGWCLIYHQQPLIDQFKCEVICIKTSIGHAIGNFIDNLYYEKIYVFSLSNLLMYIISCVYFARESMSRG